MRTRLAKTLLTLSLAGLGVGATAGSSNAAAGVVPNQFQRSCWITCSPFVQSNGTYKAAYPSACTTKGRGAGTYYLPAGRRC